jgi:hypothetical protein
MDASTTDASTDGTPASRCIAAAPASSAPNMMLLTAVSSGLSAPTRATAIAVYP